MNMNRSSCALVVVLISSQVLGPAVLWAAEQRGMRVEATRRVVISAISGEQLVVQSGSDSKALHFRDVITVGDQIATGDRTVAEVLIGNRAVVTLGQSTTAQFTTVSEELTTVQVKKGIMRVAASALALGEEGKITVQTQAGQVQTRGGIIRVIVDAPVGSADQTPIGEARPYLASYSPNTIVAAVNTRGEIIQVEEGTAEIPGAGPGGKAVTVQAGQAVTFQAGQAGAVSGLGNPGSMRTGVLASAGHTSTPKEALDNLVVLQINQATALGQALTGAAETGQGDSGRQDESKKAINGATGGVNLPGGSQQVANLIFPQPAPATSGTLTFQNSTFNVDGSLALVESAPTDGARTASQTFDPIATPATVSATTKPVSVQTSTAVTFGTGSGAVKGNGQYASSSADFQTYVSSESNGKCILGAACYALTGMSLSSSSSTQTVTFNAGVKISNSTANWTTATDAVKINSPNNTSAPNNVDHIVQFNDSSLVAQNSTLQGSLQNLVQANGANSTGMTQVNAPAGKPLVQLIDSTSTSQGGIRLDFAILQASAPLIALYGTVVGDPTNNKSTMTTNGGFVTLSNASTISSSDALASLNAATLLVKGSFLTLSAGSTVTVSTLAYLTNQSIFQVQGALVNFSGGGTLNITSTCGGSCTLVSGIPVLLTGGATLVNNTFNVAAGYNALIGSAPSLSTFANKPLLTVSGAGNTVKLGL